MNVTLGEYLDHDGMALAYLLRKGEVSPAELMEAALRRASEIDHLNALCFVDPALGRAKAAGAKLKGRFGALPFLLKDSGLAARDLPGSMGSRLFAGFTTSFDATLTQRFVADGFLPFGRTTVPEFSMAPTTEALQNGGPTHNPWDETRSPGGSSGGAAVAVATGVVPIAHGSDGGGSIRIPASCCGIYGLKPSRGLIPAGPMRGEGWGGLAADGVLSRSVRDTAAALDGIAGMEIGAPYSAPPRPSSYLAELNTSFARPLRVALWTHAFDELPVAPECVEATLHAGRILSGLGHDVIEASPPQIAFEKFLRAQIDIMAANVAVLVNGKIRSNPEISLRTGLEPALRDAFRLGCELSAERYVLAITRMHTIARQMETYIKDYDFILTPTLLQPPPVLGELSTQDSFVNFRTKASRYTALLAIINASGQPAASVPLFWTPAGLPIGVQIIAPFGDETGLLRLSAQLEEACPWTERRPKLQPAPSSRKATDEN